MRSFSATDPSSGTGKTNTWLTPLEIVQALGRFDLDPCGHPGHNTADVLITFPHDGLSLEWGGRVWLNPPYGRDVGKWLQKLRDHGNGIALVFARTCTSWFHSSRADAYAFLKGRIEFLREDGSALHNAGAPSMFLAYGERNVQALNEANLPLMVFYA